MSEEFKPAIAALERKLHEMERKANELRGAINILCVESGLPPRYPDGGGGSPGGHTGTDAAPTQIKVKADSFYGKPLATGVREILDMRRAQGNGPASPREIFDVLKAGGYQFDTKNDEVALVSLRASLRKNNRIFHKLPTGLYGLLSWYPNAKPAKQSSGASEIEDKDDDEEPIVVDGKGTATVGKTAAA